jgi:hypothetical protein
MTMRPAAVALRAAFSSTFNRRAYSRILILSDINLVKFNFQYFDVLNLATGDLSVKQLVAAERFGPIVKILPALSLVLLYPAL